MSTPSSSSGAAAAAAAEVEREEARGRGATRRRRGGDGEEGLPGRGKEAKAVEASEETDSALVAIAARSFARLGHRGLLGFGHERNGAELKAYLSLSETQRTARSTMRVLGLFG